MRASIATVLAALLLCAALPVAAQNRPPNLQPAPEPPPPPKGFELDPALEPQITIIRRGTDTVEEHRIGGRLYMIKVTPAGGSTPYYLIDQQGDGKFTRQHPQDTGLRPPMWVIHSF
jgi:ABC-type oligopeptide transport system substrate-binding subunit